MTTELQLLTALENAARIIDVQRVIVRRSGNFEGARVLDDASAAAWDAINGATRAILGLDRPLTAEDEKLIADILA